jgi:PIN domain nuclease of toxin-antitoxin system
MTTPPAAVLLDTQCLIWYANGDRRLSVTARQLMHDQRTRLLFSSASVWEIVTKVQLGKLTLDDVPQRSVPRHLRTLGVRVLPIRARHALRLMRLPLHHRDPFDRMILAQAHAEGLPVVTSDSAFKAYPVTILW